MREPKKVKWRRRAYTDVVGLKPFKVLPKHHKLDIPESVLEDRNRRKQLQPESITAAQFGDPLPGCSALAKRH